MRSRHGRLQQHMVKKLRDATGAGMMECKAALTEANGDIEEATTILRKRGLAQATKKAGRSTNEGLIGSYIHMGGKIGVLVEVNCESDFVARTDDFQDLAQGDRDAHRRRQPAVRAPRGRARRRARARARHLPRPDGRPEQAGAGDRQDRRGQARTASTSRSCLLDQPSIRDPKVTIGQIVQAAIAKLGENIAVAALRPVQARRERVARLSSRS